MQSNDTDFMTELEAATQLRPVTSANVFLFAIFIFVVFFFVWANMSEIEELTRGEGQVVPSSETQIVQSFEGGILQDLLVSEGDLVDEGQILMRVSDTFFSSEERGVEARSTSLKAKRARLLAEISGDAFAIPKEIEDDAPDIARNELALYESRQKQKQNSLSILDEKVTKIQSDIASVNADIRRLADNRRSLSEELEITKRLVQQQAVSKLEEMRLQRDFRDISGQIEVANKRLQGLQAELSATKKELEEVDDQFRTTSLAELNEVETAIKQIEESLVSIEDRVSRTEIRSPVRGTVNRISVKTIGGVIQPAQEVFEIVPLDDELKIVARVLPRDIAFLTPGQAVNVKITAYDPTRYGGLQGRLTRISANSIQDRQGNVYFEVEARTNKNHLGSEQAPLPITAGMIANIEIVTGKRTIMDYLLKPILRARSTALTER